MPRSEATVVHEDECGLEGAEERALGAVRWRTLISGDRTPTESLTLGVAELEPGESRRFRPHRHAQPEIYYVLSGEGTVRVSGTAHSVRPRTAVYIPGGAEHGALNTGAEILRLLYVFPADSFHEIEYEFPADPGAVGRREALSARANGGSRQPGLPETIRTDRVELRPFASSDGPAVLAYSQDEDWAEYQQTTPTSEREAERVVAEMLRRDWADRPGWAITLAGEVVGLVGLGFEAGHRIALLGYGIHKDHRGLGLTGEAVEAVLTQAFSVYPQLTRVTANTDARNRSSIRLLEKLGFMREGTLRSAAVTAKGELVDGAIYGLLRSEWRAG